MNSSLKRFINSKRLSRVKLSVILAAAILFVGHAVDFSLTKLIKGLPQMADLIVRIRPNISYSGTILSALLETIQMAAYGTFAGVILSVPFSYLSSSFTKKIISSTLSAIFSILRTIPSLIWAAILVSIFSVGKFSGIIALSIIAFLMSVKLMKEYIDSINQNSIDSLLSVGATRLEVFKFVILPQLSELTVSNFFLVLETNIRSATVLGLVGAGGIGQIMWKDLNHLRYDNVGATILSLFTVILIIDLLSHNIRRFIKVGSIGLKSLNGFKRYKKIKLVTAPFIICAIIFVTIRMLGVDAERIRLGLSQGAVIVSRMLHIDWSYMPNVLSGIAESIFIAVFASLIGGVIAIFLSFINSYNVSPGRAVTFISKVVINIMRTFPPIITAIIFFRGVGPGPFAGALALTVYTSGVLTKMFSDKIENTNDNMISSFIVTGANKTQIYFNGVFRDNFKNFIGLLLYRLESNIRNSSILGIIGAGGVGTLLTMNINWRNWERVGALVLSISIMIIIIDRLSLALRKRI